MEEDESEDDPEGEEKAENEETVKQAENASEDADPENKEENTDAAEMENKAQNPEDEDAYHTAMNNMAQYLSEHNYGREDYAIYSKDPEWQKLNADLQRSLGMEVTTAPESGNEVSNIDLPDNCVMVDASDIDMSTAMGMDNEHFWNHHGNTKEDYMQLAEKIPDVQQALESGKTLDEIKQDPELRNTANAYFDPENMVKVEQ